MKERLGGFVSACISRHGEFGSHTHTTDPLTCDLCHVFDEDGARQRIAVLEGEIRKLEPRPGDVLVVRADIPVGYRSEIAGQIRAVVGDHVAVLIVAPEVSADLAERHVAAAALSAVLGEIDGGHSGQDCVSLLRQRVAELRGTE